MVFGAIIVSLLAIIGVLVYLHHTSQRDKEQLTKSRKKKK